MDPRLAHALEGRYTIDREIGRGGMATVYLARDERHKRNVALKVLNPELGAVLGVERFLAEIQVTANLQHPNLLPLFDSGEVSGLLFYVMPYVEGESLRAKLERAKQLPVDEAVHITLAIAGALDYAHRHQVIHRDLKPENILMHEGQPLIADFGIALAVSNAGGARITQTGLSLGTPQYMSPEQATGDRVVDGRTDIYSLGAMLYEMLVGDPPHSASTAQAIIAKVLTERPRSVRSSRPNVPPHVDAAIGRALEKLAADRFGTAKEFADALGATGATPRSGSAYADHAFTPGHTPSRASRLREFAGWSLAVLLGAGLARELWRSNAAADLPIVRARFDVPPLMRVHDALSGPTLAVSPKGDVVAYVWVGSAGFGIHARHVNELEPRELSTLGGRNLTFSPDGRFLAFTEGNVLMKVPVEGGAVSTVGTTGAAVPYGLSWSDADTIYVGSFSGLRAYPASGGTTADIVRLDSMGARVGQRFPLVLPGGKAIVLATGNGTSEIPRLAVLDIRTGEETRFPIDMAAPLRMLDDQLVYVTPNGALRAVRFDLDALRPIGDPLQLEEGLMVDATAGVKAALSLSGTLIYLRGRAEFEPQLVAPGSGSGRPLIGSPAAYGTPRLSPDGSRMAITLFGATSTDIWVYSLSRNTMERVTTEGLNLRPEWSADGRQLVFISTRAGRTGIWRQRADGSAPAELLYAPDVEPFEAVLSPDDRWLVYRTAPGARNPRDILVVPLDGERTPRLLAGGPSTESMPRISPDGRWLAYQSSESGKFEIYVRPFPGSGARVQVSEGGASEPVWGRDGRSLYYRSPRGEFVKATVTTGARFSIGTRSVVLTGDYLIDATHPNYDVAADGRFLVLKRSGPPSQPIIVHNWGRELREKTARP